ncbi:unnamed protein product [Acanthoscelides obtectus]|uniref:Uncharacterized protein n=1 Tax=Acanthoscelides obtectus TaxID=200917 RepID=A0A9P0KE72_ACAOB|nr:unnamed protein product [Acanthoscelides obtectus]CAK1667482.1 hypothetical protein AOBTE_LOCUS25863 [Acanthoscelides obtectus]
MSKFPLFWEGAGFVRYLEDMPINWSKLRCTPLQYNGRDQVRTKSFVDVERQGVLCRITSVHGAAGVGSAGGTPSFTHGGRNVVLWAGFEDSLPAGIARRTP